MARYKCCSFKKQRHGSLANECYPTPGSPRQACKLDPDVDRVCWRCKRMLELRNFGLDDGYPTLASGIGFTVDVVTQRYINVLRGHYFG